MNFDELAGKSTRVSGYFDSDPDDPNSYSALRMFRDEFSPTIRRATEVIKGLQDENARLRTQVNDWLDVLAWAADSWPEGQPRLDDAINRYEPWP